MKSTNFTKTEVETTVLGIVVLITTEFKKGEMPGVYTCNVSSQVNTPEGGIAACFNVNSLFNIPEKSMQINAYGNVPLGFITALEAEMIKVNEFVTGELNPKTSTK